eukprot:gnl/TRDRNA2_/TRDRNA2_179334_c0_seq1.p1 gnl/TRDRNA2_/TRDRNA2_179334_c0~~gnl/TRDRNA2_/TRDRNA2_179334_c0_seq1.p1  ORF type:complete len:481 (-),score=59.94 gnl/TRDRNA2_/TRDRNA2_179334_c0_seq1:140-1582(-)
MIAQRCVLLALALLSSAVLIQADEPYPRRHFTPSQVPGSGFATTKLEGEIRPHSSADDVYVVEETEPHRRGTIQETRANADYDVEPDHPHVLLPGNHEANFESFAKHHSRKQYWKGSDEWTSRRFTYMTNVIEVERLNGRYYPGRAGTHLARPRWKAKLNHMADWTPEEFKAILGYRTYARPTSNSSSGFLSRSGDASLPPQMPRSLNYLNLSSLQTIADQGECGSCWAVVTSRLLDSHNELHAPAGRARSFSAQELIDCVPNPHHCGGKGGCDGNTITLAMDYVMRMGLASEEAVPYRGKNLRCQAPEIPKGMALLSQDKILKPGKHTAGPVVGTKGLEFMMHGWELLETNRYRPLMMALYERGPVGIGIDASKFQWYSSGIFDDCVADATLSHVVLLVGYGYDDALRTKYWDIQNSWGSSWGEEGNMKVVRSDDEERFCGIDHHPEEGSACEGGPKQVTVCGTCGVLFESVLPHFGWP